MKISRYIILGINILAFSSISFGVDIVHYKNLPIKINLTIGQERSIEFGDHIQLGVTQGQKIKRLFRAQSAQGVLHLKPYKEFVKQRVQVRRMSDGRIILLDLSASKTQPTNEIVRVILESENIPLDIGSHTGSGNVDETIISPVDLTRHASKILYGPTRLQNDFPGISQSVLGIKKPINLFKGTHKKLTVSVPIIAYEGGAHYLAGIHIRNVSNQALVLNYLDINVPFSHATFQHHTLSKEGTPGDSTILYLVSDRPLNETLYPWTYYQDQKEEAIRIAEIREKHEREEKISRRKRLKKK